MAFSFWCCIICLNGYEEQTSELNYFYWKVELGSRAGSLKQMLLDLLEDPHEIRRICIMGRDCTLVKGNDEMECSVPQEKQIAEGMLKSFLLSVIVIFYIKKTHKFLDIITHFYVSILFNFSICRRGGRN